MIFQFLQRLDGSQSVQYVSSGCRDLYELEPEVVQADFQVLSKLIHPQDIKAFEESIATSCDHMVPWRWEGRIITPSGKLKWIQGASRPDPQAGGDVIWDGLLMDITDQKLAEEKLRESEARYKAILDAIPDFMFRISRDGEYLDFKGEGAHVHIAKHEIVGKNMRDLLPPDVAMKNLEVIEKTLDSRTLHSLEYQLPTPLGIRDYESRLVVSGQNEVLAIVREITEGKQAESALVHLAQKFAKVFRCSPNPISISTIKEGRYIEVNDTFVKLSGYSPDEVIGRTAFELNIWVNQSDRALMLLELQEHGFVRNREFEFRNKSGRVHTALFSAEIIHLDGVQCLVAVNLEITGRKQAELALRESEEKFSKAFRCSPNPITILTLGDGRYVDVNDAFLQISGFSREEVIGRTPRELNIWDNSTEGVRIQQILHEQGFIRNLETEFYTKSGDPKVVLFSTEMITIGGNSCVVCVINDITERKQAEELLRLSVKRDGLLAQTLARIRHSLNLNQILHTTVNEVRQFLQADRVFVALRDANGQSRILAESVDPQYPSVLNWKPDNETNLLLWKKLLTTHRVQVVEDTTQVAASPQLTALYQESHTRATLAVPIILGEEWFGALIANQCSRPRHWQQMEIDLLLQMSEQVAIAIQQAQLYQELAQLNTNLERQVEERTAQLQQKMQEIQELNRVKDVVLHTVSHDLRTSVMGNLMVLNNLLNQGHGTGEEEVRLEFAQSTINHQPSTISVPRSIIERMIQGNDRQLGMINSLLEIHASVEQGVVLHRHPINYSTLVSKILKDLSQVLVQNQASVNNLVTEDLPLVIADPTQLQKVFVNLLTQSLQNNPPGLNFTLKATVEKTMIRCTIQDNGVGMNKLECDRLFDLSVREPQARCSTGIGLKMFLCRQIIKAHGGEMGVISSNRKRGLTFWFTLPLASSSERS
ncbi:MAG: PAS domain S-box protein [Stigonema ocellatum SAG 48.90 = DSM 106950]|nr:PAS domain S-box protein [Stigonema ocellatum SAG 48.90 = DSM 106950]